MYTVFWLWLSSVLSPASLCMNNLRGSIVEGKIAKVIITVLLPVQELDCADAFSLVALYRQ